MLNALLIHFSHPHHRLFLRKNIEERQRFDRELCRLPFSPGSQYCDLEDERQRSSCKLCRLPISPRSLYYGCGEYDCEYNIHSSCAREMVHPFHPQHSLSFKSARRSNGMCNICGISIGGSFFECSKECSFKMDITCAALMPIQGGGGKMGLQILKYSSLPRPLLMCANNNISFHHKCFGCRLTIDIGDPVLVCLELPAFLHESCVKFSQDIPQHFLHPQHPLIPTRVSNKCDSCAKYDSNINGFLFHCEQCDFNLDFACAFSTSTTINKEYRHPHTLIECYRKNKNFLNRRLVCSGCMQPFKKMESMYDCPASKQLLHKLCALSPKQIDHHPYHLAHPLSLYDETPQDQMSVFHNCNACRITTYKSLSHFYRCCECNFYLHTKCALPVAPFLTSQILHQHPLAFLDIKLSCLPCSKCKKSCNYPFFRCVGCNFNLHFHCLSVLPLTVEHKDHLHPLILTPKLVKDHDAKFHCGACKEDGDQYLERSYYCVKCHYFAHVHCVISKEDFPYLEKEFVSLGGKFDKMKLDTALDVVEDIAGPELQRDAQEEKVEVVEGAFIGAGPKNDRVTARADDSLEAVNEVVDTASEALLAELDTEVGPT